MATLDIAGLKSKLQSFSRKGNREERDAAQWRPPEGKSTIRIVPLKESPQNPFIELQFHYDIGTRPYLSPLSYGNRDPINDFADGLIADETIPVKERYAQAKPFRPKARTFLAVIVRGEEEKGVRLYSFGTTVYKQIASYMVDEDYGDITDVKEGRDIVLEVIPKEKSDTNFPQTNVKVKPNTSPLSANAEQVKSWLTNQPDVKVLFEEPTFNELKVLLERHLDPDGAVTAEAKDKQESPSVTAAVAAPKATAKKNGLDTFDDFFDN